ncbi:hypothetical protein HK102_003322 [Quaeritorhiza haematococci]|nr:hypothetical protein HK102_003322 [Quaeritorhiza haematococci]
MDFQEIASTFDRLIQPIQTPSELDNFVAIFNEFVDQKRSTLSTRRHRSKPTDDEEHELNHDSDDHDSDYDQDPHKQIAAVREYLKAQTVPITAGAPDEEIVFPSWSESFATYSDENTVCVDGFLYDEDDIDDLVEEGKFSRNRCIKYFISHSATPHQLEWLFSVGLRDSISEDTVILDVGSRLGAVLYMAYLYTPSRNIIGLELSQYFSNLTISTAAHFSMSDRIQVIQGDVQSDLGSTWLRKANVIVLHNVFQFFSKGEKEKVQNIWRFLKKEILEGMKDGVVEGDEKGKATDRRRRKRFKGKKKAAGNAKIIVSAPSLEEQFEEAGLEFSTEGWLVRHPFDESDPELEEMGLTEDQLDDIRNFHIYSVKSD